MPAAVSVTPTGGAQQRVRVKDITRVQSARENQLMGYGLVAGLNGTGDSAKAAFTPLALSNMLQKLGINLPPSQIEVKNVAAVMVTANIRTIYEIG